MSAMWYNHFMDIRELENKRADYHAKLKRALKTATIVAVVWGVVAALLFVLSSIGSSTPAIVYFFIIFFSFVSAMFPFAIIMVVFLLKNRKTFTEYQTLYKELFVKTALEEVFPGCSYDANAGIERDELRKTGMVYTGDVYNSEDLVTGEYHGMRFRQADVSIQDRDTDEDGHTTYETLFMGRWAIFDIKKEFNFKLAVVGKGFAVANMRNNDKIHKFKPVRLESAEFHQRFKVYAQDGFEAFYLLDPAFMTRVEKLGEACRRTAYCGEQFSKFV